MNVLIISPHFPPNYRYFVFALRDAGASVLGVGDTPSWELSDDLRQAMVEYMYVPDMYHRWDDLHKAVETLIHRHGPLHRIESHNEHWLEHDARLREAFGVTGVKPKDLQINRRKLGMKDAFRDAGVPVAPAELVSSREQAVAFARRVGFPLILKPDVGVGASGAKKVNSLEELESALNPLPENTVIEKFVTGRIVTYDGLADRDGNVIFETSHRYSANIMEIVQQRLIFHYYNLREIPEDLLNNGRRAVRAFNLRERFFHFEFFELPTGEYYGLEVNIRPPGGFSMDMMNYSADIDLYRAWARLALYGENELTYERKYHVAHVGRRDGAHYRLNHDQIMRDLGVRFVHHPPMPRLWAPVMGETVYILGDPDLANLKSAIARVEEVV
ncbi:MAG: ATP-grasp domain-containing protein [Phycisphaerae bacterium]|nr:ATP-grasp domain-containing protein [Phycisphaerae bacterium]MDW8263139.1 hypothetical protein [Phycisphaerales bacterium]